MEQVHNVILMMERQRQLLMAEYEAEKEEFRRQTEAVGIHRKVKRGDCWLPVRLGKAYYNSLNQFVVEVFRNEDTDIEHNFEFGRKLMFFKNDTSHQIRYFSLSATVSYAEHTRMVVALPDRK